MRVVPVAGAKGHGDVVVGQNANAHNVTHAGDGAGVDLVEGEPVLHEALVLGEQQLTEAHPQVDDLRVVPAAVLVAERQRELVVTDGYERFDAVALACLKNLAVEVDARLARVLVVSVGKDAAPLCGETEALEAHLAKEVDVLLKVMVEIDCLMAGIVRALAHAVGCNEAWLVYRATHNDIGYREAFAVRVVAALKLVCRRRATP